MQNIATNFSTIQPKELTERQNNVETTIKEADKGTALVETDTLYYQNLIVSILNNEEHCEKNQ